mgnify:CR=1 FL=1
MGFQPGKTKGANTRLTNRLRGLWEGFFNENFFMHGRPRAAGALLQGPGATRQTDQEALRKRSTTVPRPVAAELLTSTQSPA